MWTAVLAVSQLHMDFPFPSVTKEPDNSQGMLCKYHLYLVAVESCPVKHLVFVLHTVFNDNVIIHPGRYILDSERTLRSLEICVCN